MEVTICIKKLWKKLKQSVICIGKRLKNLKEKWLHTLYHIDKYLMFKWYDNMNMNNEASSKCLLRCAYLVRIYFFLIQWDIHFLPIPKIYLRIFCMEKKMTTKKGWILTSLRFGKKSLPWLILNFILDKAWWNF